ncbi:MAG: cytochrome c biogenesis protein CcsA [Longimicrobiales bacterium]
MHDREPERAPPSPAPRDPSWVTGLGLVALVALIGAQAVGLQQAPDSDMGDLQKIMYVHVPAAWNAFLAFGAVFVLGILYLWRRWEHVDLLAAAFAEAGTVLTGLTLALGSIWGRPTWGVWWTWDARLTTTAVLFVLFVGYLALRAFTDDAERRARWSAAVGILGFLNVIVVYKSVQWWRTLHQVQSSPSTVAPEYVTALRLNAVAFLLALAYFTARRYTIARAERAIEDRIEALALSEEHHAPV